MVIIESENGLRGYFYITRLEKSKAKNENKLYWSGKEPVMFHWISMCICYFLKKQSGINSDPDWKTDISHPWVR